MCSVINIRMDMEYAIDEISNGFSNDAKKRLENCLLIDYDISEQQDNLKG